ncbi:general substrate transporter [Pholiota conissans]|uniref:General substrate transporter n=1 Tax=Pholiota conissans TaxID=109636 RepID=A0A9P5Z6I0_9AGAR|nr:general substrate transporter [Pholiota conissans]
MYWRRCGTSGAQPSLHHLVHAARNAPHYAFSHWTPPSPTPSLIFRMGGPAATANPDVRSYGHLLDPKPWYKNSRLILLNFWIVILLVTSSTNGYDGSMMNGLQSLPQWQQAFNHPTGGALGLLGAIQNIGSLSALPFAPYIADGLGRRSCIILGACLMIIGTVVQTASQNVHMFIGARWLIGFGLNFAATGAPMLISEVAYPSQRGQLTSLYNSLWIFGSFIAAWTTFGTFHIQTSWSWRIPSAIQGFPSVIQLALIWFVPESPRWLMYKGREAQALKILAYYHARGNEKDPLVEYEYQEIKAAIELDREVAHTVGWLTLFKTRGNLKRVRIIVAIAFFSQWSGNGLASYYLNKVLDAVGVTDPTIQLLINGVLQIYNFVICVFASLWCDKIGRRKLFITATAGMLATWVAETICFAVYSKTGIAAAGHAFIAMIFIFSTFYALAYSPLIVTYAVEILPYNLRSKGFTIFNFTICLSLIFNQYVNPIALQNIGWKYYTVYIAWLSFELAFICRYLVETKNRTLEETAALFDGDDQVALISNKASDRFTEKTTEIRVDADEKSSI